MTNYREFVLSTESVDFEAILDRFKDPDMLRILHASMGICTEAGELTDAVKKHIFYGKTLDKINLIEEIGDLGWYEEVLMDVLLVVRSAVEQINAKKLRKRYGEKFSEERANKRDLSEERLVLEDNSPEGEK